MYNSSYKPRKSIGHVLTLCGVVLFGAGALYATGVCFHEGFAAADKDGWFLAALNLTSLSVNCCIIASVFKMDARDMQDVWLLKQRNDEARQKWVDEMAVMDQEAAEMRRDSEAKLHRLQAKYRAAQNNS